ncbi:MAG: hypothetical protein WC710_14250 [Gallionella sp.]|jgi:hypothetical protein
MATRTVTGTVYKPDGTAYYPANVVFTLVDAFETATEHYPAVDHTEATDAAGQFSTALGVPDTGTAYYRVTLPDNQWYEFYLAAGAAVDLVTLIVAPGSSVAQSDLQTLLDNNNQLSVREVTGAETLATSDEYIYCTGGAYALTVTPAIAAQTPYIINNYSAGVVTLTPTGADTINGAATWPIQPGEAYSLVVAAVGAWHAL